MWRWLLLPWWRDSPVCDPKTGLSTEAGRLVDSAIALFRQSKCKGDENWDAAFSALSTAVAMKEISFLDIRLYMCLTDDGYRMFQEYMETCDV
jgi:hypothetical protein